jgi:hypothetical protein
MAVDGAVGAVGGGNIVLAAMRGASGGGGSNNGNRTAGEVIANRLRKKPL